MTAKFAITVTVIYAFILLITAGTCMYYWLGAKLALLMITGYFGLCILMVAAITIQSDRASKEL